MSWSKRGGYTALALAAVLAAGAVMVQRRRPEVWHTLPESISTDPGP